ncbi:hypothetical protein [Roseofilum sp. Guam]|uniref:hypothetical protein n=1 Tax=Roseofilum sp. Guam TaxID=2821502 RepID=UPI001B2F174C|nr:hypothetical protein [Roseofilum sp. Guam]MBP0029018.1 hypothetical protein [Roseofilum sp. Guam]
MARPLQRIEREIEELESAIASLAEEFYQAYGHYTQYLGQAVRQQLIVASYQICTQGYPHEFLELSLTGRQKLQERVKRLAQQAEAEIQEIVSRPLETPLALPSEEAEEENEEDKEDEEDENPEERNEPSLDSKVVESEEEYPLIKNPEALAQWQQNIEKQIFKRLEHFSHEVNQLLRKASIFTENIPEPLIEVAKQAMGTQESLAPSLPNILNLVIEAENFLTPRRKGELKGQIELPERLLKQYEDSIPPVIIGLQKGDYDPDEDEDNDEDEDDDRDPIALLPFSLPLKIMLINLRLLDIEFSDAKVTSYRKQLRHLQDRLYSKGQDYQRKQKEYAIAQAEHAWRSSWVEDRE